MYYDVTRRALALDCKHWHQRWLVTGTGRGTVLHRVHRIKWDTEAEIAGQGQAVCGVRSRLVVPGVLDRMELKRCSRCCRLMGIPQGKGAPYNALTAPEERDC
jgi:hypothetical protein